MIYDTHRRQLLDRKNPPQNDDMFRFPGRLRKVPHAAPPTAGPQNPRCQDLSTKMVRPLTSNFTWKRALHVKNGMVMA